MKVYEHFKRLRDFTVTFIKNQKSGKDMEVIEYKTMMPPGLKQSNCDTDSINLTLCVCVCNV